MHALSTLSSIRTKVRRLTRSPSVSQLPDSELDNYINTFILYDLPPSLRLDDLSSTVTFYTSPNVDRYESSTSVPADDPLYDFSNRYLLAEPPAYCAGSLMNWYQSRETFYSYYPFTNSTFTIGYGDAVTTHFEGTLTSVPVMRGKVTFSSKTNLNIGVSMRDDGNFSLVDDFGSTGNINYVTGSYSFDFNAAPASGEPVYASTVPYTAAPPVSILYDGGAFILRPIPDRVYPITMSVQLCPTQLLDVGAYPLLDQWWQYIAYGAAKKVFEDRSDIDSVTLIMPEFKNQERLVQRRTILKMNNERSATIYAGSQRYNNTML